MLRRGYFAHGDFVARLRRFGVRARSVGENLAWGTGRSGEAAGGAAGLAAQPRATARTSCGPASTGSGSGCRSGRFAGYPLVTRGHGRLRGLAGGLRVERFAQLCELGAAELVVLARLDALEQVAARAARARSG